MIHEKLKQETTSNDVVQSIQALTTTVQGLAESMNAFATDTQQRLIKLEDGQSQMVTKTMFNTRMDAMDRTMHDMMEDTNTK